MDLNLINTIRRYIFAICIRGAAKGGAGGATAPPDFGRSEGAL